MLIPELTISIVLYHTPVPLLQGTLAALAVAIDDALANGAVAAVSLLLIDNGAPADQGLNLADRNGCECPKYGHLQPIEYFDLTLPQQANLTIDWLTGHGNIGYGAANNLALLPSTAPFHLVLNPDVVMAKDCLSNGLRHLNLQPNTVLVSPVAQSPGGEPLYLAKRLPTLDVLFFRGFAPKWLLEALPTRRKVRLSAYEYREVPFDAPLENVKIVSGAFMLLRQSAAKSLQLRGFDARYFLYFEDFDLSVRLSKIGNVVREPSCKIIHAGGGAGKKGLAHIAYFVRSAARFFRQHRG